MDPANRGVEPDGDRSTPDLKPEGDQQQASDPCFDHEHPPHEGLCVASKNNALHESDSECLDETTVYKAETLTLHYLAPHIWQAEELSKTPFVCPLRSLETLDLEYARYKGYPSVLASLKERYRRIRYLRPGADSFYLAFAYATFELMILDRGIHERIIQWARSFRNRFRPVGVEPFVADELYEKVMQVINLIAEGMGDEQLEELMNQEEFAYPIIAFMRLVNATNMRLEDEHYAELFPEVLPINEFCKTSVEPLGAPVSNVHISSLSNALGLGTRIEYLEPNVTRTTYDGKTFVKYTVQPPTDFPFSGVIPRIFILCKPDQFYILHR